MPARTSAPMSRPPVQAAQPIKGGKAPTTDPTHVFRMLSRFMGVYTDVYRNKVPAPARQR